MLKLSQKSPYTFLNSGSSRLLQIFTCFVCEAFVSSFGSITGMGGGWLQAVVRFSSGMLCALRRILGLRQYTVQSITGAPRGAFHQSVYDKYMAQCLRVLARPLTAVHNDFCLRH